jgi:ATP-binding cassette subfamily B protein
LDSWAEADWFDRFRSLARGKTAIVITHRLIIARQADVIHVMDAGRIVESGTHEQLLEYGKLYAGSWFAQVRERGTVNSHPPSKIPQYLASSHPNGRG